MVEEPVVNSEADRSEMIALPRGQAVVYCAKNPFKETPNEDGAMVIPLGANRAILAVADGMGGMPQGAQASEIALDAIARSVADHDDADSMRTAILNGFESANRRVTSETAGSGTTLSVLEVDGQTIRPYHVGDSEIIAVGQRGRVKLQTVSHSPVAYAVEAGLLDAATAMHHEDRHLLTNFVGAPDMRIDVGPPLVLKPRDTVVLGSDGLFDNLHIEEVVARVRKGPLSVAADTLAATCRRRILDPRPGHPSKADDVTFIIYRPHPKARRGATKR
ncbi:MAG: SpoIIE family protein phosphatase [Planctomycetes bacterium]|nr:SpoIIE family protein phosphatase [Planctomycetota bacterium]